MRKFFLGLLLALLATFSTSIARAEIELYGGGAFFDWHQKGPDDIDFEIEGPVATFGLSWHYQKPESILTMMIRGDGFVGELNTEDESESVDAHGAKLEFDLGLAPNTGWRTVLEPFAGIGVKWSELKDSVLEESLINSYGRLGLRARYKAEENPLQVLVEAGARIPLTAHARIKSIIPDPPPPVELVSSFDPREKVTPFAELSLQSTILRVTGFYEGMHFTDSGFSVRNNMFGLRVGLVF